MPFELTYCKQCENNLIKTAHLSLAVVGLLLMLYGAAIAVTCGGPMPQEAFIRSFDKLEVSPVGFFMTITGLYYMTVGALCFGDRCHCCYNEKCLKVSFVAQIIFISLQTVFIIVQIVMVYPLKQTTRNIYCGDLFNERVDDLLPDVGHLAVAFFALILGQVTLLVMNRGQLRVMDLTAKQQLVPATETKNQDEAPAVAAAADNGPKKTVADAEAEEKAAQAAKLKAVADEQLKAAQTAQLKAEIAQADAEAEAKAAKAAKLKAQFAALDELRD